MRTCAFPKYVQPPILSPASTAYSARVGKRPRWFSEEAMTRPSILIVDDSAPVRRMVRSLFDDWATVHECGDGAAVTQCYAAWRPDWVLMDVGLKGVDGLTATRRLLEQWPQARVVIVANYDDEGLRAEAHAAGACDYVLKENLLTLKQRLQAVT